MSKAKGKISNKTRAHPIYRTSKGDIVPGVTTIINLLNKPALVKWSNDIGLRGISVERYVDDKAEIGTLAHAMIMAHLQGKQADTSDYSANQISQAENCCLSFFEWEKSNPLEPLLIETPLVSEQYRFGGTFDIYAVCNGQEVLIDLKTGSGIYPEHAYQLAAYETLLLERDFPVEKAIILNIGRAEDEAFAEKAFTNLERERKIFMHCLAIYNLRKELKNG